MRYLYFILALMFCTVTFTSCVFIDDCHYETKCTYVDHCSYVCDRYGDHCIADECWQSVDKCWDEYVCEY